MSGEGRVVCVTGGSGYIASWIISHLLQRGYTVKATLRNPDDPKARKHLFAFDGAKGRLQLFKADLLDQGSFDQAVHGCEGVFHTASPVILSPNDPQAELIDPALKGTLNVLESCAKVPTLKRVVITSSIAAVMFSGKPLSPDVVVDETWFTDPVICQENKLWYPLAKALAEDAAWRFAKEHKIDMVIMNPGLTLGPLLLPSLSTSVEIVTKHINAGAETFPNDYMRFVDVRDVANAHILAFERPSASGRYCLVANVKHFSELLKIVHENYPTLQLPDKLFSWNGTNCCVWDGIQCDHTKGVVISVDLFYFGLLNMNGHSIWPSLTKLKSLEVLNLRYNNFNGVLPASLGNNLYGEIPEEISRLVGLVFLNLSRNHISGRITQSISKLQQLLSLDLSSNDLSGSIPPVMSEMTFLQTLDLSNNHLLGRIPDGNQMMTFNKSSFSGNPGLCGKPINVSCGSEDDSRNRRQIDNGRITEEEEADEEKGWYMMSIGAGFFVGVVGPFLLFSVKRSWGGLYFAVVDLIVFKLSCGKCKAAGRKRSR